MIQAVDRAIQILEILEKEKKCGVTEIGQRLLINKSTASRLLSTLEHRGLVIKDEDSGKYSLGLGLLRLSQGMLEDYNITKVTEPYLNKLVDQTGESAHLCVLSQGTKAIFIQQVKSPGRINVSATIGSEESIHCSAVGKSMAAYMPLDQLKEVIEKVQFQVHTPRTITSPTILMEQFERVRRLGYAIDDEEVYTGVRCVAAPIWNYKGEIEASIGVSGPANRIELSRIDYYGNIVVDIANQISAQLGYTG